MSKYQDLSKNTAKLAAKAIAIVVATGALYGAVVTYGDNVEKQKAEAEAKATSDNSTLTNLRNQVDKSGEAEKRFATIQAERVSTNYVADREELTTWLRAAVARYRFKKDAFKLTLVPEVASDKPELMNFNYNITLRPHVKVEIEAISDTHVFSFIDELRSAGAGFIRIDHLDIKRKGDVTEQTLGQIRNGEAPSLVEVKMEITWIGLTPKEAKSGKSGTTAEPQGSK